MAITWDAAKMSSGMKEIDEQHKELIRRYNAFFDMVAQGKGRDMLLNTLRFLVQYADSHFKHEEGCMTRYNCPSSAANRQAHDKFRAEFGKLLQQVETGGATVSAVIQAEQMLSKWLTTHICTVDVRLREVAAANKTTA